MTSIDKVSVVRFSDADWEEISEELERYDRDWFAVDLRHAPVKQGTRVVAIITPSHLVALGLARSRGKSGSLHTQILVSRTTLLAVPISITSIVDSFSSQVEHHAVQVLESGGVFTERASSDLQTALGELDPDAAAALNRLRELQRRPRHGFSRIGQLLNEQRDAIALGLEAAGLDSDRLIPDVGEDPEPVPFLTNLALAPTSEASVIRHDMRHFSDWQLTEGQIHDVVHFTDPRDRRRRVTVLYADKEGLEYVTGTDLIYYREDNPTFVLVQYKRMHRNSKALSGQAWEYRPDEQLFKELNRMRRLVTREKSKAATVDEWRLNSEPFYFKLIEDNKARPEGNRLARGMYFPFDLFELTLADPRILGARSGRCIGWHNAPRYFTNTDFLALLQNSFIGSTGVTTTEISTTINQVLAEGRGAVIVRDETSSAVDRRRHA